MKFMSTWSVRPECMDEAIARFIERGNHLPPGVKMLGRWHNADHSGGFSLMESDSAKAMYESAADWSDLLDIQTIPVVEDAEAGEIIAKMASRASA